jgi:hypothetical protein
MDFKVKEVKKHTANETIQLLRAVTLKSSGKYKDVEIYRKSTLTIKIMDPDMIWPTQNYVHRNELKKIEHLICELQAHNVNMFMLDGYITMTVEDDSGTRIVDLLPPVVERSEEDNGIIFCIINDGMHRLWLAREMWTRCVCIYAEGGAIEEYPYYAYPRRNKWAGIEVVDYTEFPKDYNKKRHRVKEPGHKDFYRDFNTAFQVMCDSRPRATTPMQ